MSLKRIAQPVFLIALASLTACVQQSYTNVEDNVPAAPIENPNARAIINTSRHVDSVRDELSGVLGDELFENQVELRKTHSDTLQLTISGDDAFKSGHTRLNKTILSLLDRMASVLSEHQNSIVHIVSHTDSTGSDQTNLNISEKRATVIANHLERKGVTSERIISAGRGEHEPIMPNDNASQQALNRRIEVYVIGITAGNEARAYQTPTL